MSYFENVVFFAFQFGIIISLSTHTTKVIIILNYYSKIAQKMVNSFGADPTYNHLQIEILETEKNGTDKNNLEMLFDDI